jgi:hypothetical protein
MMPHAPGIGRESIGELASVARSALNLGAKTLSIV